MSNDLRIEMVFNNLRALGPQARRKAALAVAKTALGVERTAKRSMNPPKQGNIYIRGGRMHQASAPGEPPAIDTSNLKNATRAIQKGELEWWVVAGTEYAWHLEMRMDREFIEPAADKHRPSFEQAMMQIMAQG